MSTTAVHDFLTKIGEDQALQGEMAKALEADNDREAVTALAQSNGYEFTSEELWQEIQARQAEFEQRRVAGELSDEELEAVAGGEMVVGGALISLFVTSAAAGGGMLSLIVGSGAPAKW